MFPSFYVQVRQWGAWKLHPYNSDARKSVFYHIISPFSSMWNESHDLVVMVALQIAPRTRTKLVEVSQHHHQLIRCLLSPSFMLTQCDVTYSTFLCWPFSDSDQVVATLESSGVQLCSLTSYEDDGGPLESFFCFCLTIFLFLLREKDTALRSVYICS